MSRGNDLVGESIHFPYNSVSLVSVHDEGSKSTVYMGQSPSGEKLVVKHLNLRFNQQAFQRELEALQHTESHPNFIKLLDHTQVQGQWGAFLFEYAPLNNLRTFVQNYALAPDQVFNIFKEIVHALKHLHEKGLIHRDLRLESIYVFEDLKVKLGDLGSSITVEDLQALYGVELSEDIEESTQPETRAPELLDLVPTNPLGPQTDMWALGCLVYELLCGEKPFLSKNKLDQMQGSYKPQKERLSEFWKTVLDRLLEVNPKERATSQEILALLKNFQEPKQKEEASRRFSLSFMMKKSSASWVKSVTSDSHSPPEQYFIQKLIEKAWAKPYKISKAIKALSQRTFTKPIVALKCLYLLHKYLFSGPNIIARNELVSKTLESISESSSKLKKEKLSTDYCSALIKDYASILNTKVLLLKEIGCLGNWKLGVSQTKLKPEKVLLVLDYWTELTERTKEVLESSEELANFKPSIAVLMIEEQQHIARFLNYSLRDTQEINLLPYCYKNQQKLYSLISSFRENYPLVQLTTLDVLEEQTQAKKDVFKKRRSTLAINVAYDISPAAKSQMISNNLSSGNSSEGTYSRTSSTAGTLTQAPQYTPDKSLLSEVLDSSWIIDEKDLQREEVIGVGSSCSVYKGVYHHCPVAIKVLRISSIPGTMEREFQREISTLSKLRHPNHVLFMGAFADKELGIVTEYCEGQSLFALLHEKKEIRLSWKQKLKIATDIAQGMTFLHQRSPPVIHRDLKSLNLLLANEVTSPSCPINVKISDFGVSKLIGEETMTSQIGTSHWMAPEILANKNYSLPADVYSYGIVLWEVATRLTPYKDLNPAVIPYRVLELGERPNINLVPPTCPQDLKQLIADCWQTDPESRPTFSKILTVLNSIHIS